MTTRPLRNRVDPWGQLNGVPDKVALRMGNRGRLHNEEQEIVRDFTSKRWITCCLERKGTQPRKGKVFGDGYSELFFLDEATAFAAGHRPCFDCQPGRYKEFVVAWKRANPDAVPANSRSIDDIDAYIHGERVTADRKKKTYEADLASLPSGTFVEIDGVAFLLWKGKLWQWSFSGYSDVEVTAVPNTVTVLTPESIVTMFADGFETKVHPTIPA